MTWIITQTVEDTGVRIVPEDLGHVFEQNFTGCNGRVHTKSARIGPLSHKRIPDRFFIRLRLIRNIELGQRQKMASTGMD